MGRGPGERLLINYLMIRYKVYQSKREGTTNGKYYARAVATETYSLDKLAEHMASHNTPYSKGIVRGVLTDMVSCIKELVLDGKQVKIDDLAIFKLSIVSAPALTQAKWTPATNIRGYKLNARATGELRPSEFKSQIQLKELDAYAVEASDTTEP